MKIASKFLSFLCSSNLSRRTELPHEPLSDDIGAIVRPNGTPLLELDRLAVIDLFKRKGALLFRGFDANADLFTHFSNRFSDGFRAHPNERRQTVTEDRMTVLVDPDFTDIAAHQELGYLPITPDILWFHCICPASRGGQTTIYDGVKVLAELPSKLRDPFESRRIRYSGGPLTTERWQHHFGPDALQRSPIPSPEGTELTWRREGESIWYEYVVSGIVEAPHSRQSAFVNSILVAGPHRGAPPFAFEDGTELSKSERWQLLAITDKLSVDIRWQAGDIVMIDNRRCMHGRRGFKDASRSIAFRMCFASRDDGAQLPAEPSSPPDGVSRPELSYLSGQKD